MKRLLLLSLRAQNLNVSGTVLDGDGSPVAGASVVVKASNDAHNKKVGNLIN